MSKASSRVQKNRQVAVWILLTAALAVSGSPAAAAATTTTTYQETPQGETPQPAEIVVAPAELTLEVGQTAELEATVKDASGSVLDVPVFFFTLSRRNVGVTINGTVEAYRPGSFEILARVPADPEDTSRRGEARIEARVPVTIPKPPVASVEFVGMPSRYYSGTLVRPEFTVTDASGAVRRDVEVTLQSSDPTVVSVNHVGYLEVTGAGTAEVTAWAEEVSTRLSVNAEADPTASLDLEASALEARAGDVLHFTATPRDAQGRSVPEMPVEFTFRAKTSDHDLGSASSGMITADGRFVADLPGGYTIIAVAGNYSATETVSISPRNVRMNVEIVGRGKVVDRKTSDLWVWTAPNGRDYAVTGTWGAEGHAYFWDVTDPGNIVMVDTIHVDARTVNDVKVSEDGSICVISREGASSRRNGIVVLDVADIENNGVKILSRFDADLTGGVHNVFIYQNHVYALSAGQRYDIINIEDPRNPHRVGRFELDTPGHSIHDVWVSEGIAYSANWTDGVVVVDVGGGDQGGSPANPILLGSYAYPSGWNHSAFPYYSRSAGKFYVFAGDEYFPADRNPFGTDRFTGPAVVAGGWIHVIEWDEWDNPKEVARYQVPEAGPHNFWIEDDILYVGYYNAGLRVVDISGELLGNLYSQGREIASLLSDDPAGFKANASRVWGAQLFKGLIYFADNNSGLWAVRLKPKGAEDR